MTKWSGLAPAVDAHLARWGAIDREWTRINALLRTGGAEHRFTAEHYPHVAAWAQFAKSWGVPDGDGIIQTPIIVDGQTINGREQFGSSRFAMQFGAQLMEKEHRLLTKAETHYVSVEVVHTITVAAEQAEPEPLFDTDIITPYGLAIFEQPIWFPDLHPTTGEIKDWLRVAVRAIGWIPEDVGRIAATYEGGMGDPGPGVMMFLYTTSDDWIDSYKRDVIAAIREGLLTPDDFHGVPADASISDLQTALQPPRQVLGIPRDMLWPVDVCPWRFKTPWKVYAKPDKIGMRDGEIDTVVARQRRWFMTFMRFCWQRIVVSHRQRLTKKASRRIELERKVPPKEYSVLRLRREDERPKGETGTGMPLGYRQLVRRHPRRVYCPSLGPARNPDGSFNEDSHRLMWIDEHWRGPDDGPIGPLHKATSVVR